MRKRTGVFCLKDERLLAIELQDPTTKKRMWSLPGGAIEEGESPQMAALRETLEETGYSVTLNNTAFVTEYAFRWNGTRFDCQTHWFGATCDDLPPQQVDDADYILKTAWLPWPQSRILFSYHPAIIEAVTRFTNP